MRPSSSSPLVPLQATEGSSEGSSTSVVIHTGSKPVRGKSAKHALAAVPASSESPRA